MSLDGRQGDDDLYGGTGQTRTRLPEGSDVYGGARRPGRSSSRSLITVVGVVVLLIAAIAFANRGGDDEDASGGTGTSGSGATTSPTAPTGTKPTGSAFAHDEQGAQSAAANYAVRLGGDGMFNPGRRHEIVQGLADPSTLDRLQSGFDADYSQSFLKSVGLDTEGRAPAGTAFVNRTLPAGTKVTDFSSNRATVAVWCNGLFGLTGDSSKNPVTTSWFTVTMKLNWSGGDWKVLETRQKTGPTPVNGDNPVSGSDEIGDAVKDFGGFTYAR
ncbi:hypothetical protein GTY65_27555 [Streptomyces sp. SID8379]|uniref:hypothetical protein n=1 Tax=unclassified Streptomyces TaxID=2593676 RepID=UPI0003803003|nr:MULTISPECIES: hypothetical protein [unclassified Streptomyces]MYW67800.1 hypothetical protein [Streptomyces sp. SID8379]